MFVYEIAKVTAPADPDDHTAESTTTYSSMVSHETLEALADVLEAKRNTVSGNYADSEVPVGNRVLYVNWREVGKYEYPEGWYMYRRSVIDADEMGVIQAITDENGDEIRPLLKKFDVVVTRDLPQSFSIRVEAENAKDAMRRALEISVDPDMSAEWDIDDVAPPAPEVDLSNVTEVSQ